MLVLKALLIVVLVLCCLMLIGLILLQKSKSEGLGLAFGAGAGESLFGARAGNVLSKATVILGIVFMASSLALGVLFAQGQNGSGDTAIGKELQKSDTAAAQPAPVDFNTDAAQPIVPAAPATEAPAAE